MTRNSSTSKKLIAVAFVTLLAIASATSALAQMQEIKGKIPFSFNVGSKVLPAGEYVTFTIYKDVLAIQSVDRHNCAFVIGLQSFHEAPGGSALEFDRIGDSYFLRRVLCPTLASLNIDIPTGQPERNAREREARLQSSERVLVAMK